MPGPGSSDESFQQVDYRRKNRRKIQKICLGTGETDLFSYAGFLRSLFWRQSGRSGISGNDEQNDSGKKKGKSRRSHTKIVRKRKKSVFSYSSAADWKTLGIISAGGRTGATHLAVWTANYLTGVRGEKTAVLEWNSHGDFKSMERFCRGEFTDRKNPFHKIRLWGGNKNAGSGKKAGNRGNLSFCRILDADYYEQAGAEIMAACLNGKYRRIIADYGELTGESFCECTRCDKKVLVGSFSEWQTEAFLEAVRMIPERDESWQCAAVFGSEETRKEWEKQLRIPCMRIPVSEDAFAVTASDMKFFERLLF